MAPGERDLRYRIKKTPRGPRPPIMSQAEIGWLAGLIDGEGCISLTGKTTVKLEIKMTDEDIVRKLHEVTSSGHVSGPHTPNAGTKLYWTWAVTQKQQVIRLLLAVAPMLGVRRAQRALEAAHHLRHGRTRWIWLPTVV